MTTILVISSFLKGEALLKACKEQGARVLLLTEEKLANAWNHEYIDKVFMMPSLSKLPDVIYGVAYLARGEQIERIIPLDEYDVEMAAILREHLRVPGMGITTTKHFRDKLIMRQIADEAGILVPPYTPVINYDRLRDYMGSVAAPWVLKPRLEAGAMGIKRVANDEEVWRALDVLGDQQSFRVLEQYIPGDVYHVDSLTFQGETVFSSVQKYGAPPLNVAHDGGIFITFTTPIDAPETAELKTLVVEVIRALGLTDGSTHAEFIRGHADGKFYFLEIAARVGGAHIADLVAATTGVNPWAEWAKIEIALARGVPYTLPATQALYGGLLVCLARQEHPDLSSYQDPEIVWRMDEAQHAGLIVASEDVERVQSLVKSYQGRFINDFLAVAPPKEHN